jgi:Ca-activated chloride channel family protein
MRQVLIAVGAMAIAISMSPPMGAETLFLRGKVTREDGSPPGKAVSILLDCAGVDPRNVAIAGKSGDYLWRAEGDLLGVDAAKIGGGVAGGAFVTNRIVGACVLRADLSGFRSSTIDLDDTTIYRAPQLPVLVITPKRPGEEIQADASMAIPKPARRGWAQATKAMSARDWAEAERQLRSVTLASPKFRQGWVALGLTYQNERMPAEARDAFRRAADLDAKSLQTKLLLAHAELECQNWAEASRAASAVIAADSKHRYLGAWLYDADALYHLNEMERAEARVKELLQLDRARSFPLAEYVLGLILESRKELDSAREHMAKYLEIQPNSAEAAAVRTRMENLGKPQPVAADVQIDAPNLTADSPGEAAVPGGLKAFARMARLEGEPAYDTFFLEYCRKILHEISPYAEDPIPVYLGQLQAYMAAVEELTAAGVKRADDSTLVTLSLKSPEERKKAARVLRLLGWTLNETAKVPEIGLGDRPEDGMRHAIPAALGIDEIAMRDALEGGRSFEFEIRSDTARLIGGVRWAAALKNVPPFPGGMADVFSRDTRFAQAYAGLGAMSVEAALGLLSGVGVNALVTRYADVLEFCSAAWSATGGHAVTPGGKEAMPVWAKVAGADPADSAAFFRALLVKDGGRLAAFYSALSQADESRQRFFTASSSRAQRFYEWYRDSPDMRTVANQMPGRWRGDLFREIPLDDAGRVRFPGGRAAWSDSTGPDEEALLGSDRLEALIPVASMERMRGAPLDQGSASLLARHYTEWRNLFPYFEKLPGLGSAEFQALAAFALAASEQPAAARNILLGEWHSLVKLIVMGEQAGSLDPASAARGFARVCEVLAGPDPSMKALAVLQEIAGGSGSLDEAVASNLLRLSGPRRASFDRVRELQSAPSLDAALTARTPAAALAALSGTVYAAVLEPDCLPISEDPRFLSRHRFVPSDSPKLPTVFFPTALAVTLDASPSYVSGGFMTFEETARALPLHKRPLEPDAAPTAASATAVQSAPLASGPALPTETVFRATGQLVEVPAIVTDGHGRYIDYLTRADFQVLDDGEPAPIAGFENQSAAFSLALVLDTTGSMHDALPPLKSAALKLIAGMRPKDYMAVYGFNVGVTELQPFTTDKAAAERAVLKARAQGATALYDALVRVIRDMAGRTGKKAIVVFTDGDDNRSLLTAELAVARAKAIGATIYTIAQGFALRNTLLLDQLASVSKSAGGLAFAIHDPAEVLNVFESISRDLTHGYLLTFQPSPARAAGGHNIKVTLPATPGREIRARAGYDLE